MFNPSHHLMKIGNGDKAKDYLPVAWRLVWFRERCPQGSIETEMILLDLDRETEEEVITWVDRKPVKSIKKANGFVIFKAIVKDGMGGVATATKSEKAASFPDFIEKAETGAIGRALAALGYGTQFTGDEFDEKHRIVDSPVERSASESAEVKLRSDWAAAYHIVPGQVAERWSKYLVHVLGSVVADADLSADQLARINSDVEEQRRKLRQRAS